MAPNNEQRILVNNHQNYIHSLVRQSELDKYDKLILIILEQLYIHIRTS